MSPSTGCRPVHADHVRTPAPSHPTPSTVDDIGDDTFVVHVDQFFAAAPGGRTSSVPPQPKVASRPPATPPTPTRESTATPVDVPVPAAADRRLLRCESCGWAIECVSAEEAQQTRFGCILCGGPLRREATAVEACRPDQPTSSSPANHRLTRRRAVRSGVRVEFRRGSLGLGADLAAGLADLCEDGIGLRLKTAVRKGDEAEVVLTRPGGGRPVKLHVEVCWCAAAGDGTYRAGARFQRRLAHRDLLDLCR